MKKLISLLLAMLLLIPAALADYPDTCSLTFPYEGSPTGSLTLEWYDPPRDAISSSEVFIEGLYVEEKWEEAWRINLLLAEAGDTLSMLRLGDHCMNGLGTPQDEATAMQWYERAQAHGNRYASRCIALMYLNGWGVEADAQYAVAYAEPSADRPVFSNHELACLYLLGCGNLAPDMEQAMYWFDQYADKTIRQRPGGVTESEYQERYEQLRESFRTWDSLPQGLFTRPHPIIWSNGIVQASDAMDMGTFWRNGEGGVVDHVEAARWFEMAIEMDGNSSFVSEWSHAALADYYRDGTLGVYDVEKAIYHAERGCTRPYSYVGDMYWNGIISADGTVILAPDAEKAIEYYLQGVEWNDTGAIAFVADAYYTGENLPADYDQAIDLYLTGMQLGNAHCAEVLEGLYAEGKLYAPEMLRRLAWTAGNGSPSREADTFLLTLAKDLVNGKTAEDGTVLVEAEQYEDAYWVLRHLASYEHLSNVWVNEQMGWFYSGNVPEVRQADYTWALRYYKAASDQGSAFATRELGILYRDGLGTEANPAAARYYFGIAARAGDAQAQVLLDAMDATE